MIGRSFEYSLAVARLWIAACGAPEHNRPTPPPTAHQPDAAPRATPVRGHLTVWQDGLQIGYERYDDDGETLTSELFLRGGSRGALKIGRSPRRVAIVGIQPTGWGADSVDPLPHPLTNQTFPIWQDVFRHGQPYALAAEWFPQANHQPIQLVGPPTWDPVDGTVVVSNADGGGRRVELAAPWGRVVVDIAATGHVTRWANDQTGANHFECLAAPNGIDEELLEIARPEQHVTIRGSLWLPRNAAPKLPIVVFHAGSGPTDRDWNGPAGHLRTNTARMLAAELAKRGVASFRYDKRHQSQSQSGVPLTAELTRTLSVQDYADDLVAVMERLRRDGRLGALTVAGHSEGGMIALLAAQSHPPDALIIVNSVARLWRDLIRFQLARRLDAKAMAEYDRLITELRAGGPISKLSPALEATQLFERDTLNYLRSEIDLDPAALLGKLPNLPVVVLQGESDVQQVIEDVPKLARVRPGLQIVMLPRVNHVLKEEAERAFPQTSYDDAERPLGPGVVDAFISGVRR